MRKPWKSIDPCERTVALALDAAGYAYTTEEAPVNKELDFHVPAFGIHLEVKQFHSERSVRQMARVSDAILIQGKKAAEVFGDLIRAKPQEVKS